MQTNHPSPFGYPEGLGGDVTRVLSASAEARRTADDLFGASAISAGLWHSVVLAMEQLEDAVLQRLSEDDFAALVRDQLRELRPPR